MRPPTVAVVFLLGVAHMLAVSSAMAACPLDLSSSNFTMAASLCSNKDNIGKCCRYINAFVAISVARYANTSGSLGVASDLSDTCLRSVSQTLSLYGVAPNATVLCGFGTKIPVNYECKDKKSVKQMLESPQFVNVSRSCEVPVSAENDCKKCVNAAISYLYSVVGSEDSMTFSTCRDATFAALASQLDIFSTVDLASCYFGVPGISSLELSSPAAPEASPPPTPLNPANPNQLVIDIPHSKNHRYHPSVVSSIGIAVTASAILMLIVLLFLIRKKKRQLRDTEPPADKAPSKVTPPPRTVRKFQEGPTSLFRKFSYKETKSATDNFTTVIGQGGFGIVFKAQFKDGLVVAVKRMNKISEQAEDEFCREIELFARLHHRHLVALRGYCMEKHERFLMYEFMANGSLKDHLHAADRSPLSWQTRIQIAIDVANALEYLHFYCDPPLCHRDIKSSNILLDEHFVAKVADFGLAHASKDGSICFEPVNTEIRGTPGYMDPEYMITQELTEKSDVYSYGVLILEIITGRKAIQDNKNLVEWAQPFMSSDSTIHELVDPNMGSSFDFEQLQAVVAIVKWCTQKEGAERPSIKQVLRLLYESSDPLHSGFIQAVEDEDYEGGRGRTSKGKVHYSGDARGLASSSSTTRSYCSRSFLLESGSPQSPRNDLPL
uniref:Protein kinase domain-containing protein n=1 Tax=Kalanchoe fedtschenkoi TaxID=63787 RepID=A0A7N0ZRQ7_KALFE